jgi:hypothetical protein
MPRHPSHNLRPGDRLLVLRPYCGVLPASRVGQEIEVTRIGEGGGVWVSFPGVRGEQNLARYALGCVRKVER